MVTDCYTKSRGFLFAKEWCWSWNSSTLATSCKELTPWKRLWCWEGLGAGGEGNDRGWDGWMASPTQWTWAWVNSGSWWWTGRPGVLQITGLQRGGHDWATELNWTDVSATILMPTILGTQKGIRLSLFRAVPWVEDGTQRPLNLPFTWPLTHISAFSSVALAKWPCSTRFYFPVSK